MKTTTHQIKKNIENVVTFGNFGQICQNNLHEETLVHIFTEKGKAVCESAALIKRCVCMHVFSFFDLCS